jgi:hypothetical protein
MEDEQLPGDEISTDSSQLNPEIGREEGQGSWDQLEIEQEEDSSSEIEAGQEAREEGHDSAGEPGVEGVDVIEDPEEKEEEEQKNTLQGEPNRVLSFKDFFNKN